MPQTSDWTSISSTAIYHGLSLTIGKVNTSKPRSLAFEFPTPARPFANLARFQFAVLEVSGFKSSVSGLQSPVHNPNRNPNRYRVSQNYKCLMISILHDAFLAVS